MTEAVRDLQLKGRPPTDPFPRAFQHRRTDVHGSDDCPAVDQPGRERAGPTTHVQHLKSGDLTDQRHRRWAFVIRIERALVVVGRVLHRRRVVLPSAALPVPHPQRMPLPSTPSRCGAPKCRKSRSRPRPIVSHVQRATHQNRRSGRILPLLIGQSGRPRFHWPMWCHQRHHSDQSSRDRDRSAAPRTPLKVELRPNGHRRDFGGGTARELGRRDSGCSDAGTRMPDGAGSGTLRQWPIGTTARFTSSKRIVDRPERHSPVGWGTRPRSRHSSGPGP
jgi:hypothetical protein